MIRFERVVMGGQVVEVSIDASDVPSEYALTILSECAAFPRRLVFFLKGTLSVRPRAYERPRRCPLLELWTSKGPSCVVAGWLQVKDHVQTINLAPIDTYFMLNCFNNTAVPAAVTGASALQPAPTR